MKKLPASIQTFFEGLETKPVSSATQEKTVPKELSYRLYYWKAVAGMLLSGRVKATNGKSPNKTDVERICKEANFNQYLLGTIADFLIAAEAIVPQEIHGRDYIVGPHFDSFFGGDIKKTRLVAGQEASYLLF